MDKHDDYVSGPHHYWPHFFAGLGFGALFGWWIACSWLDGTAARVVAAALGAVGVACFAGRLGEVAWPRIAEWLKRWWEAIWRL